LAVLLNDFSKPRLSPGRINNIIFENRRWRALDLQAKMAPILGQANFKFEVKF
jgi:hypothetical protein